MSINTKCHNISYNFHVHICICKKAVFLVLFYIFLRWVIRRTPVTEDDDLKVRRISRLLERLNEKWNPNRK